MTDDPVAAALRECKSLIDAEARFSLDYCERIYAAIRRYGDLREKAGKEDGMLRVDSQALAAARLAGRLEQAEKSMDLFASTLEDRRLRGVRFHHEANLRAIEDALSEERDRLRKEVGK